MDDNWTFVRMLSSGKVPSSLLNTDKNRLSNTLALSVLPNANSPQVLNGYPVFEYASMVGGFVEGRTAT